MESHTKPAYILSKPTVVWGGIGGCLGLSFHLMLFTLTVPYNTHPKSETLHRLLPRHLGHCTVQHAGTHTLLHQVGVHLQARTVKLWGISGLGHWGKTQQAEACGLEAQGSAMQGKGIHCAEAWCKNNKALG